MDNGGGESVVFQFIDSIVVVNSRGQTVYSMDAGKGISAKKKVREKKSPDNPGDSGAVSTEQMTEFEKELKRTGVALDTVLKRYRIQSVEQMTQEIYGKAMRSLKNSKDKKAA